MREPVTSDERVSYVNAHGQLVVYNVRTKCALCRKCLADQSGRCMYGGPFAADGQAVRVVAELTF